MISCLWDGAYKRTLAANRKEYPCSGPLPYVFGPSWSYFSFQPVLHDWCNKGRGMWDGAEYKRTLAVNRKE